MSLVRLPYELIAFVVHDLDLNDIRSLSYTCKRFQFLVREAEMAKRLLEARAPHSAEARDARLSRDYAAGLRRLIKRRDAVASVSPYLVSIVGFAQEWMYENGVLCYCRGRELRVLDLHRSASCEVVVNFHKLVREALPGVSARHKYKLTLLYYSHDILSCIYTQIPYDSPGRKNFLLVFNALKGQLITVSELPSVAKLFVRNDDRFLYYGTTTEPGAHGDEYWVIRGFNITTRKWLDGQLEVPEVIGTDVGSTVCFEIIDGDFYGLSNLRSLIVEEVDWVSYYSCFKFPLHKDGFSSIEFLDRNRALWRRDHTEGPLDDRWSFLRLFKDETTGQLKIVESRKEWLEGRITARRTYYTSIIGSDVSPATGSETSTTKTRLPRRWPRDPNMVHPGDDNSALNITLTKCPVRSYHPACQTFIDIVDDSNSFDPRDQKLRLRGGTRRPWTPGELGLSNPQGTVKREREHDCLLRQIDTLYRSDTGLFWPPNENPSVDDPALADLYTILNPPGYVGNPHGSWDERSIVYASGGAAGGLKALIFLSWDPCIRLVGTAPYPGDLAIRRPGSWAHSDAAKTLTERKEQAVGTAGLHPTLQPDATSCPRASLSSDTLRDAIGGTKNVPWRTLQPAMYRHISRGYHFAR